MNRIQNHIDALFFALIQMLLFILIPSGVVISCLLLYNIGGLFGLIILLVGFIILYVSNLNKEVKNDFLKWEQDHETSDF